MKGEGKEWEKVEGLTKGVRGGTKYVLKKSENNVGQILLMLLRGSEWREGGKGKEKGLRSGEKDKGKQEEVCESKE